VSSDEARAVVVVARRGIDLVSVDVAGRADLALVDTLARLALAARRVGASLELRMAGPGLMSLLELVGLAEALRWSRPAVPSALEPVGQPEDGEQAGVEEVVVADDPAP
jgi:hypothetical protein